MPAPFFSSLLDGSRGAAPPFGPPKSAPADFLVPRGVIRRFNGFGALVASTLLLYACKTTNILSRVGNQAQYSKERRGYVVSTVANPDDAILLVDPLRLRKVRCRE